jgi:two-component system, response regulator
MNEHSQIEILFIEDNHHEAELTIRSLKKHSLSSKLKHISDGPEALDFIFSKGIYADRKDAQNPKLILLDLKLPKVGGLEILRQLKADEQTRIIPVVILTSSKEEKDVIESYRLGVNSYIVKPVNFESLNKAIFELGLYWLQLNHNPYS